MMFCELIAVVAANAALIVRALGGVHLAGGIVRRFPDFIARSGFRRRFESHPFAGPYLERVPTSIITTPQPGLPGAYHLLHDDRCL